MKATNTIQSNSGMTPTSSNRGTWALFTARMLSAVTGIVLHAGEVGGHMGWWDWS